MSNMPQLLLSSSLCKDCGVCCFSCEYLDTQGCTNNEYRLQSRCASFPLLFGNPDQMGHENLSGKLNENMISSSNKGWFVFDLSDCILQQNEMMFNTLRWIIEDINNGKDISWYFMKYGENEISITVNNEEN